MSKTADYIIAGAGIIGLATAYKLIQRFPGASIAILEKENSIALHQTGRNSGVLHSGIYYRPGSQKALRCIDGYRQMVAFCQAHGIPYEITGKLIVATNEAEDSRLISILENGKSNGLNGLQLLPPAEVAEKEPYIRCTSGLWVPQTGIVDYRAVAKKLHELVVEKGVEVHFNCAIKAIREGDLVEISTEEKTFQCRQLITCCGLHSDRVARLTDPALPVRIIPFRGEYFRLKPEAAHKVNGLVYPVPDPDFPFLGVHFTKRISGEMDAGPNAVLAFAREGYTMGTIGMGELAGIISYTGMRKLARRHFRQGLSELWRSLSKTAFANALKVLLPSIAKTDLTPIPSGVRAQAIDRDGNLLDDFLFLQQKDILHVVNAPSPGATASLSIADGILEKIGPVKRD